MLLILNKFSFLRRSRKKVATNWSAEFFEISVCIYKLFYLTKIATLISFQFILFLNYKIESIPKKQKFYKVLQIII